MYVCSQHNPKDPFITPCTGPAVEHAAGAVPDVSPFQTSPYGSNPVSTDHLLALPVNPFDLRLEADRALLYGNQHTLL
jgi:hypothetical protein